MKAGYIVLIVIGVIILSLIVICVIEVHSLSSAYYKIESSKLSAGERSHLVFISDLHGRVYGKNNDKLIDLIKQQKPDAILIGGDILVSKDEGKDQAARQFLERIKDTAPVYLANGNHEKAVMTLEMFRQRKSRFEKVCADNNVNYLINETAALTEKIDITGIDVPYKYYRKFNAAEMEPGVISDCVNGLDKEKFNIVMAHSPKFFENYSELNCDVVLAGHYHGGGVRLPFVGGVISPQFRLFPKYSRGRFEKNGMSMIVSAGCGSHTVNLRIFNRPEIVILDIEGKRGI